ncbi:MAG: T9SS type A sorting domain-containing protein [Bacteroidales bacterium]|nr:T9SS type A sorting domain-containing protein [Bacteroidales bacterium]
MKKLFILLLITFLSFSGKAYTWNILGPDSVNATNICFGAAFPYWVICTDDGMYFYNYSTQESTFYTNGYLPIQGATHLNAEKMLVVMGDGSWSDGIYTFDLQTFQFEVVEWIPNPAFLIWNDQSETYYAGFYFDGLYSSSDGLTWNQIPYFSGKSCACMCYYGDHLVVSEVSNIYNIHWSDDAGINWNQSPGGSPLITDMWFNQQGKLYGIFPLYSNSSGLWRSNDYGNTWNVVFWSDNMSAVGYDVFGNIFVGWESPTSGNEGIAYYDPTVPPPGLTFFNNGLGNTNINRILINPIMSAPALFVCTDGGVFLSYDIIVETGQEKEKQPQFSIYPNPAYDHFYLDINLCNGQTSGLSISIYTCTGSKLAEYKKKLISGEIRLQIKTGHMPSGIYYCELKSGTDIITRKLIIH